MKKPINKILLFLTTAAVAANMFAFSACGHTHTPEEAVRENVVAATCAKEGSYDEVVYCSDCKEEISRTAKTLDKLPHTPAEAERENVVPATCTEKGSYDEVVYCAVCDGEISRDPKVADEAPHTYAETLSFDETGHWYACLECGGKGSFAAHTEGPAATETSSQTCTECEYVFAPPIGHTHRLTPVQAREADCEHDGNTAYYTCGCGQWFSDASAAQEIKNHDTVVIKSSGHKWNKGVIEGDSKTQTCGECGDTRVVALSEYTVTFNYNYTGAPRALTATVKETNAATEPATPTRSDGRFEFGGWFTDRECNDKYDFATPVEDNLTLYARWGEYSEYIFEAEYTDVSALKGRGYSNEASGVRMIMRDDNGVIGKEGVAKASNGFFISYFYVNNGQELTFVFNSDRAVKNSTLKMRLSGELLETVSFTSEEFIVRVNGEQMDYADVVIDNINTSMAETAKREFQDFLVTASLELREGENTVTMQVNNNKKMTGTIGSTAPLIDCIKVETSASLEYSPILTNLRRFED